MRNQRVTTTAITCALVLGWVALTLGCTTADRAAPVAPRAAAPVTHSGGPSWLPHAAVSPQLTLANITGRCELVIADPHMQFPLVAGDGSQVAVAGYDAYFGGEGEGEHWANEGLWLIDVARSGPERVQVVDAIRWAANDWRLQKYASEPNCARLRFAVSFVAVNEALGRRDWFEMTRIGGLTIWADDGSPSACVHGAELELCLRDGEFGVRVADGGWAWGRSAAVELFVHPSLCVAVASEKRQHGPSRERNAVDVFDIAPLAEQLPAGFGVDCSK